MKKKGNLLPPVLLLLLVAVALLAAAAAMFDNGRFEVILKGDREIVLEFGEEYVDPGAFSQYTGSMNNTPKVKEQIAGTGDFDLNVLGTYTLTYRGRYLWRTAEAERTVRVVDTQKPTIVLIHNSDHFTLPGHEYEEEGFRAEDNYDGDITDRVTRRVEGNRVIYTVADSSGNTAEAVRTVAYGDPVKPELTLLGDAVITMQVGTAFTEPGYKAVDNLDGDLTSSVRVEGTVDIYRAGTYTIRYMVTDSHGNQTEAVRTVIMEPLRQPDNVPEKGKVIYLTFDDGPGPYTEKLLEILNRYNVKATFFVVNSNYLDVLPKLAASGHTVAIHTYSHVYNSIYASEDAFWSDLNRIRNVIHDKTGVWTNLMRFPGGSSNKISSFNPGIMTRLTKQVTSRGYHYFDWNVDSDDAGKAATADEVFNNVISGIGTKTTAIVLQHDIKDFSVDAVERIVQWGLANGYVFCALNENSPTSHHPVRN